MHFAQTMQRRWLIAILLLMLGLSTIAAAPSKPFPDVITLPDGFQPEGIASGTGTIFYVGSIPTGDIYRGDFRTGEGELLVDASLSDMTSGFKSFLARLAQPFFRREGGGSRFPIRISGPRSKPEFGLDMGRVFRRGNGKSG